VVHTDHCRWPQVTRDGTGLGDVASEANTSTKSPTGSRQGLGQCQRSGALLSSSHTSQLMKGSPSVPCALKGSLLSTFQHGLNNSRPSQMGGGCPCAGGLCRELCQAVPWPWSATLEKSVCPPCF